MDGPRIPEEEVAPRGRGIYERRVRPGLRPEDEGAFVVIDVGSGRYEVAHDEEEAFSRAEARDPGAVLYVLRVGEDGAPFPAYRIGAGGTLRGARR